jgi:hypothetical protein
MACRTPQAKPDPRRRRTTLATPGNAGGHAARCEPITLPHDSYVERTLPGAAHPVQSCTTQQEFCQSPAGRAWVDESGRIPARLPAPFRSFFGFGCCHRGFLRGWQELFVTASVRLAFCHGRARLPLAKCNGTTRPLLALPFMASLLPGSSLSSLHGARLASKMRRDSYGDRDSELSGPGVAGIRYRGPPSRRSPIPRAGSRSQRH